jgi:glycosyltransferase involved in cell wall biosynthesis
MPSDAVQRGRRILFASYHGYIDPSSGAAVSVRELLTHLAKRGWEIRTFCGPLLDFDGAEDVRQILADEHITFRETVHESNGRQFSLLSFRDGAIRSSVFVPAGPREDRPTERADCDFLAGYCRAIAERPDLLLTYGGGRTAQALFRETQRRAIPLVFWLHNFAYRDARLFESVARVIVPSECSAAHYRKELGLKCHVLACPLDWDRVTCDRAPDQRYVTFVNPLPHKGVFVFARIAEQLFRRRPDIPLLIVEGRSGVEWLERTELDLSGLTNLNVMKNTPDPRDFYRVSQVVLMPSVCRESFGRVAAEAMINGIPALASNRGALREVVSDAGFLFDVPARYTPESRVVPSAEEVSAWVETIIRLWDDRPFYKEVARRSRSRVEAWRPEVLLPRYEEVFATLLDDHPESPSGNNSDYS